MKLRIMISKNKTIIPFDYQHKLAGVIHKWLGKNEEHGKQSTFSFSSLQKGELKGEGFDFPNGSLLYFSSTNNELLKKIYQGIKNDPILFNGLSVLEINLLTEPIFRNKERFILLSPILIKKKLDKSNKTKHLTFEDSETEFLMTESVKRRLEKNGITDESLKITFDNTYYKRKTKVIKYKGIGNKTSVCPIIVEGKPESMAFIWNNGVGNSTGIGFGCLK